MSLLRAASLFFLLVLALLSPELMAQTDTASRDSIPVYLPIALDAGGEPAYDLDELAARLRYPEDAMMNGIEGDVMIEAVIDSSGAPLSVTVVRTDSPLFVEAATEAVHALRFTPGRLKGKPVRVLMTIPLRFRLVTE